MLSLWTRLSRIWYTMHKTATFSFDFVQAMTADKCNFHCLRW
jgi:hypothetical protein